MVSFKHLFYDCYDKLSCIFISLTSLIFTKSFLKRSFYSHSAANPRCMSFLIFLKKILSENLLSPISVNCKSVKLLRMSDWIIISKTFLHSKNNLSSNTVSLAALIEFFSNMASVNLQHSWRSGALPLLKDQRLLKQQHHNSWN